MAGLKRTVVTDQDLLLPGTATSGGKYVDAQSTASDFNGPTIDCKGLDILSFTCSFGASALRDGDFRFEVSNDPRAWTDPTAAVWTPVNWPDGSVHGDATASGADATIGVGAGDCFLSVKDLPRFGRLVYDSQTAGAAATVTIWVFGQ